MKNQKTGYLLLILSAIIIIIGFVLSSPIIQLEEYHDFADKRKILGMPNFWDVASNIPFLIVGILGLMSLKNIASNYLPYLIFFVGITLCFFGSAYYHWSPTTETLVWDRLPMTIAFMSPDMLREAERETDLPLINPVVTAVKMAEALVTMNKY